MSWWSSQIWLHCVKHSASLRDIEQQQEREKILLKTTSIKNKLPALRVTMVLESKKDS